MAVLNAKVSASEIATYLGRRLTGVDLYIKHPASLTKAGPETIVFATRIDSEIALKINTRAPLLLIGPIGKEKLLTVSYIASEKPRLDFAKAVGQFFLGEETLGIDRQANIDPSVKIGLRACIGPNVRIGPGTTIGDDCLIHAGASIYPGVTIGNRVKIDSCAVIGAEGYGFEREAEGNLVKFPQIGGVVIEDDVEIGANACIDRGTLDDTIIRRGVKIDNLVHVSHNCIIGEDTLVIAQACICGSVTIGRRCWIGPHSSIIQKIKIGDGVKVGISAVVLEDVSSGGTVMGNPAVEVQRFGKIMLSMKTRNFLKIPQR